MDTTVILAHQFVLYSILVVFFAFVFIDSYPSNLIDNTLYISLVERTLMFTSLYY